MKRTTWIAVLVTATTLAVAGNAPRLPWEQAVAMIRQRIATATVWPVRTRRDLRAALPSSAATPKQSTAVPSSPHVPPLRWPALPRVVALPRLHAPALPGVAPGLALALTGGAVAGIALALLLLALVNAAQGRRGERRHARILRLALAGQAPARIAREARVPRDAVRTLLAPDGSQPR